MTKKSAGRLARDAKEKEFERLKETNTCWDELKQIGSNCADMMVTTNSQLAAIYKTEGLINFLDNPTEVKTMLRGLSQDLTQFNTDLSRIFSAHKERSGGFKDEEDFAASITIFEEYHAFQTRYESVVSPTVNYLLEQAAIAEKKIYDTIEANKISPEEQQQADLVNPEVISDAVIKA